MKWKDVIKIKFDYSVLKYVSLITQVGLLMLIPVVGCMLLGIYLDNRFNTGVIFLIIFTLLGILAAFRNLYVLSQRKDLLGKKDKK